MSEQLDMTIEPTEDHLQQVMRGLGFSEPDIEENRELNGRLYLAPSVIDGAENGFEPGAKINTATGDLV